jgi:hypothetical protein
VPSPVNGQFFWKEEKIMKKKTKTEKGYTPLTKDEYIKMFDGNDDLQDITKLKNAHKLAWETRNFEIDKFWIRTAFFGGFTVLIFNGYINILSASEPILIKNLDICLIYLGIIFSVAWLLSVLGSKSWQENWEAHIDMLEDKITGPLYKTIYCKKALRFYSVSTVNEFLVYVIIVTWILLLVLSIKPIKNISEIDCEITIGIVLTVIVVVLMFIFCRSSGGEWKIKKGILKSKKEEFESGVLTYFIDRYEKKE